MGLLKKLLAYLRLEKGPKQVPPEQLKLHQEQQGEFDDENLPVKAFITFELTFDDMCNVDVDFNFEAFDESDFQKFILILLNLTHGNLNGLITGTLKEFGEDIGVEEFTEILIKGFQSGSRKRDGKKDLVVRPGDVFSFVKNMRGNFQDE